jgi:thiol:disulfide interchange protein DsbD
MGLRSLSNRLLGACVVLLATCAPAVWSAEEEYLPPEQAFPLAVRLLDAQRIELRFDVAPGYYLYRDKITVTAQPSSVALGETTVPRGTVKYDATFEKDVESLRERVPVVVSVPSSTLQPGAFQLQVGSQGCADKGLCYPPMQRTVQVEAGPAGLLAVNLPNAVPAATASSGGGLLAALTGGGVRSASEMPSATGTGAGTSAGASGAAGDEAFGRGFPQPAVGGGRLPARRAAAVVHALRAADGAHPVVDHRGAVRARFARPGFLARLVVFAGDGDRVHRLRRRCRLARRRLGRSAAEPVGAGRLRLAARGALALDVRRL